MSVAFYMDEHVPFAITAGLTLRGVDVLTVQDDNYQQADDPVVLDRAMALGRVVFTQDDDFLRESHRRQAAGEDFAGVVYAHQLNVTIGQCVADLELIAKVYEPEDMVNRVEYLPPIRDRDRPPCRFRPVRNRTQLAINGLAISCAERDSLQRPSSDDRSNSMPKERNLASSSPSLRNRALERLGLSATSS